MNKTYSTSIDGTGLRVVLVDTRWNQDIVGPLGANGELALREAGVTDIDHAQCPGAFELPLICKALAVSGKYDLIIAFGCVIRGETTHYDFVAGEAARGITNVQMETGVPIMFGVLTTENREQALERALPDRKNKGAEIARDGIAMANAMKDIRR